MNNGDYPPGVTGNEDHFHPSTERVCKSCDTTYDDDKAAKGLGLCNGCFDNLDETLAHLERIYGVDIEPKGSGKAGDTAGNLMTFEQARERLLDIAEEIGEPTCHVEYGEFYRGREITEAECYVMLHHGCSCSAPTFEQAIERLEIEAGLREEPAPKKVPAPVKVAQVENINEEEN